MEKLLASARIKPAVNQIEVHPHWPQKDLVKFCQNSGVHVTAFGPLGCTPIPALVGRAGPGPLDDNIVRNPGSVLAKYLGWKDLN